MTRPFAVLAATALLGAVGSTSWAGEIQGNAGCGSRCGDYVVYVETVPGHHSGKDAVANFGQENKVFVPHVLAVLKGTTVRIGNSDPFLHNVHIYRGKETVMNMALPFQGQTIDHVFDEEGNYLVLCDAHPEMSAFIVVLENPFFGKPDESGEFEISGLASGTYTLIRYDAEKEKSTQAQVLVGEGSVKVSF